MATYVPPKRATEFIFYVSLTSQADIKLFQANPTLATGDVKVSTDGAAFGNLTTLPTVTPAAGRGVKVTVSAAEMTGDNVLVVFSDASGAEWSDLAISIQTVARQNDDLAFPTTSGRSMLTSAAGGVSPDWANVEAKTSTVALTNTTISSSQVVASVTGAVGSVTGAVGSVTGAVGSVTGAVGSVTGAVGSVTGNVGGNVTGSVGSVVGAVGSVTALGAGAITNVQTGAAAAITAAEPIDANIVSINDTDVIGDGDSTPWGPA